MLAWRHQGGKGKAFSPRFRVERSKRYTEEEKNILIRSMGDRMTPQLRPMFEPILLAMKPVEGTFFENWDRHATGLVDIWNGGKQQTTSFNFPKSRDRRVYHHMTIKPTPLMVRLIEVFTVPGQTVLDPFMGTGTTGEAAILTNRDFIGIERDTVPFEMARKRLKGIQ